MQYGEAPPAAVGLKSFPLLTDASMLEKSVAPTSTIVREAPGESVHARHTICERDSRNAPNG